MRIKIYGSDELVKVISNDYDMSDVETFYELEPDDMENRYFCLESEKDNELESFNLLGTFEDSGMHDAFKVEK